MNRISSSDELEVCEEVGRGAFGVVYRGIVKASGREVAIKQIDLEHELADFFEVNREIQILSECQLAQITRYLGCFVKRYKLWVVMEFVDGGLLFELLKPGPITDEKCIALVAHEVLVALDYLHTLGKIHRDLKSQNILLNQDGDVKLTDFGVSTQLYSNFSRRNTTVGTPYWMAPEVILNNTGHSYKADIWLLGCCVYELRNGKPPLQDRVPPMRALRMISACKTDRDFAELVDFGATDWLDLLKDFLRKCFTVDPGDRASAAKLLKHKFVTQNKKVAPQARCKSMKQLITRRHLWDQENHVVKTQKIYAPTELALNQQKWRRGDTHSPTNSIHFDFSVILDDEHEQPVVAPAKLLPNEREASVSPAASSVYSKGEAQPNKALKNELVKILNKIFHKMEVKAGLSTEQYDHLVQLNDQLIKLYTPIQMNESGSQSKILVSQYLKYLLRELNKLHLDPLRSQLLRQIIPTGLLGQPAAAEKKRPQTALDDIERSLLDLWLDRMSRQ